MLIVVTIFVNCQLSIVTATYTGLSSPPFKSRVKGHYQDIKNYKPSDPDRHKSGTRLSRHIGELNEQKIPHRLDWKIIRETKTAYNPATNYCKLCTMEKYFMTGCPKKKGDLGFRLILWG